MSEKLNLPKFSVGVGDRFAHQARAQLAACVLAAKDGVEVAPVWNKSNREHTIIGSDPSQTRRGAEAAGKETSSRKASFLGIVPNNFSTAGGVLQSCHFFSFYLPAV